MIAFVVKSTKYKQSLSLYKNEKKSKTYRLTFSKMFLKNILFAFSINIFMVKRMIALNWITCSYYPNHGIFSELFAEYQM